MSYSRYREAVLRDRPTAFFPLGMRQPGGASSLYVDESARRVVGPLTNHTGTNGSGVLVPRLPFPGAPDPWTASGADGMFTPLVDINTTDLTIEAWIYLTTSGSPGDIYPFGLASTVNTNAWTGIRYYLNNFEAFIGDTSGNFRDISRIPAVRGRWAHVVMSYNGTSRELRFSLDGVDRGTVVAGGGTARQVLSARVYVGRYNSTFSNSWPSGSGVSCLSIYDRFDRTLAGRHFRAATGRGR